MLNLTVHALYGKYSLEFKNSFCSCDDSQLPFVQEL